MLRLPYCATWSAETVDQLRSAPGWCPASAHASARRRSHLRRRSSGAATPLRMRRSATGWWPGRPLELRHLVVRHGAVERVGRRHRADQDQHDQAHALLAVIRAMGEADTGAGEDQQAADPERRRLVALRRLIELGRLAPAPSAPAAAAPRRMKPISGESSSDLPTFGGLAPIDAAGGAAGRCHQVVGQADADDRADQRVRAGGRQAEHTRCRGSR